MSTAYSGSTAIKARNASASAWGTSSCASSAAQESKNAAPKIDKPDDKASQCGARCTPAKCMSNHCKGNIAAPAIINQCLVASVFTYNPNSCKISGLLVHPFTTLTNNSKKTLQPKKDSSCSRAR